MKTIISLAVATALSFSAIAEDKKDYSDASYAIGVQLGLNLKGNLVNSEKYGVNIDVTKVMDGINDALVSKEKITYEQAIEFLKALDAEVTAKMEVEAKAIASENVQIGDSFRKEQQELKNIVTTESGLQYKVIKQGSGDKPTESSNVTVHYSGTFLDGTSFDSSYDRGQPATFPLTGVIKGWTEGLQLMSTGSIFEFTIPADLAYGDKGNADVPPGATLIFVVELISFE